MGENGAGKSTLSKILAGAVTPDAGRIFIDNEHVSIRNPIEAQAKGIGIIYQELDLFPNLTVAENIVIGNLNAAEREFRSVSGRLTSSAARFWSEWGFAGARGTLLSALPMGQLQLVALARALSMKARLILMDEPTSSLTEDRRGTAIWSDSDLKQSGVAIVYVSHKMDEIFRICDRVTVLRDGEIIGTEDIGNTTREAFIRMMVGRNLEQWTRTARPAASEVLLSVSNLTTAKLHDISFELKKGEVLGIAGLVGAGRSELGAALFGLHKRHAGEVRLRGNSDSSTLSCRGHRPRHWPGTGGSQTARADDADERARKQHGCEAEKFSEVRLPGPRMGTLRVAAALSSSWL